MFNGLRMWLRHLSDSSRGYSPAMFQLFLLQEHVLVESLINQDHLDGVAPRVSDKATRNLSRLNMVAKRCYAQRYFDRLRKDFEPTFPRIVPTAGRFHKYDHYELMAVHHTLYYVAGKYRLAVPNTLLDVTELPSKFDEGYIRPNKDLCDAIHPDMWAILRP